MIKIDVIYYIHYQNDLIPVMYKCHEGKTVPISGIYKDAEMKPFVKLLQTSIGEIPIIDPASLRTQFKDVQLVSIEAKDKYVEVAMKLTAAKLKASTITQQELAESITGPSKSNASWDSGTKPPAKSKPDNQTQDFLENMILKGTYKPFMPEVIVHEDFYTPYLKTLGREKFKDIADAYDKTQVPTKYTPLFEEVAKLLKVEYSPNFMELIFSTFTLNLLDDLCDMLCLEVKGESDNRLYDSMFYIPYLYKTAISNKTQDKDDLNYRTSYVFMNLSCNVQQIDLLDVDQDNEDTDTVDDEEQDSYIVDKAQMLKSKCSTNLKLAINDAIKRGKVVFASLFDKCQYKFDIIQKICISSVINRPVYIEVTDDKFDTFNFTFKEYYINITYAGTEVSPTILGGICHELRVRESKSKRTAQQDAVANDVTLATSYRLREVNYNNLATAIMGDFKMKHILGLESQPMLFNFRPYSFELEKIVNYYYNGKNYFIGFIVKVKDKTGKNSTFRTWIPRLAPNNDIFDKLQLKIKVINKILPFTVDNNTVSLDNECYYAFDSLAVQCSKIINAADVDNKLYFMYINSNKLPINDLIAITRLEEYLIRLYRKISANGTSSIYPFTPFDIYTYVKPKIGEGVKFICGK